MAGCTGVNNGTPTHSMRSVVSPTPCLRHSAYLVLGPQKPSTSSALAPTSARAPATIAAMDRW